MMHAFIGTLGYPLSLLWRLFSDHTFFSQRFPTQAVCCDEQHWGAVANQVICTLLAMMLL